MQIIVRTNKWLFTALFFCGLFSCSQELSDTGFFDDEDLLFSIATYIEENQENFERFQNIVDITGSFDALNAYNPSGNGFTFFLPTDVAVDDYIANSKDYSSFDDLLADTDFCMQLIRYHMVNRAIRTTEFPYGVLPDSTASGDYLTIGIEVAEDTSIYRVNNLAAIKDKNIEVSNGFIHVVDQMLDPIIYTSYEWLMNNPDFSILASLFEHTGLKDTMDLYISTSTGELVENAYTVLAEPDSIFNKAGISNIDDLIQRYNTPGLQPDDPMNNLYQFAAYHLLEGIYFLDAMTGNRNYNTFTNAPVSIRSGYDIVINPGVEIFKVIYTPTDTLYIDYILPLYDHSNINTRTGAIHAINQVLNMHLPEISDNYFMFYEEPVIQKVRNIGGTYEFEDKDLFKFMSWEGPDILTYYKSSGTAISASNNDYLLIEGDFILEYEIPKVLPGVYQMSLRVEATNFRNATIEVFLDDIKIGSNYNLIDGGTANNPYTRINVGTVTFNKYESHTIRIQSLIPGVFNWDWVAFIPK